MKLIVIRNIFTDVSTQGEIFIENTFGQKECFSMEPGHNDPSRPKGPIPCGTYEIQMIFSPHFQKEMPHLLDVPNFQYIMIHPLNWPHQSEGCIGVGTEEEKDKLIDSQKAFNIILPKIKEALKLGKVYVEIREETNNGRVV